MSEFILRPAVASDMSDVLDMCEKFHATTDHAKYSPFNRAVVEVKANFCLNHGVLIVAESGWELIGVVGLFIAPSMFNDDVLCGYETMWWVTPNRHAGGVGKALVQAVEPACKARGASAINMLTLHNSPPQAEALLLSEGYVHAETVFIKVI